MDLLLAGVLALAANADCKECKVANAKAVVTKTVTRSKDRLKVVRKILRRGGKNCG